MANNLQYKDFALDEYQYFVTAYNKGLRYNAMVGQAQRICECYLKQAITKTLLNNNEIMMSHNLRSLFEYATNTSRIPIQHLHTYVMQLNNFYTHTRYPGREAFMATTQDIEAAFKALSEIVKGLQGYI